MLTVMVIFGVDDKICFHSQKECCNLISMIFNIIIGCITVTCDAHINNSITTTNQPFILLSVSPYCPLNYHSFSLHSPLNKASTMICFAMLFFMDWNVVYWVSDKYARKIDYLSNKAVIILGKLTKIPLKVTISMAKQLSYWCFGVCNVKEHWILWNYCLGKYFDCSSSCWLIFDTIGYIYSIWTKVDAIHSNCTYILYVYHNGGCKLQYWNALNTNVTILLILTMIDCGKLILNMYGINNFELIILTIISVSYNILYQIKTLYAIYAIICGANLFIVIDHTIPQALVDVFMLIFKFNTNSCGTDSRLFYSMAMKMDDYWFSDVYVNIIDYLQHNIFTIIFKLIKLRLEMALVIPKHSLYWYFQICNEIDGWTLWNYSYWCRFKAIRYNCINFGMKKGITNYKMDQTCIISFAHVNVLTTSNESPIIKSKIDINNKFDTKAHALIEPYQNTNKISDIYLKPAIISVFDRMKHAIEILVVIYTIIIQAYVFIAIYDTAQKASNTNVNIVFMITNYDEFDINVNEMKFCYSVTNTKNRFNAIITNQCN